MQGSGAGSAATTNRLRTVQDTDSITSPRVRASNRRDEIVAAAARFFAVQGYHTVGMREIAEAVGVRGASLYNHFSSKEEVLYAIALKMTKDPLDDQLRLLDAPGTPATRLRSFIRAHIHLLGGNRVEHLVALTELKALTAEHQAEVAGYRKYYQQRVSDVIVAGVLVEEFQVDSPSLAAVALLDMLNGISWWLREDHDLDELTSLYESFALDGLLQHARGTGDAP